MSDESDAILFEALAKLYRLKARLNRRMAALEARIERFPVCRACGERYDGSHVCLGVRP